MPSSNPRSYATAARVEKSDSALYAGVAPGATGMLIAYGVHYDTGPLPWIAQFLGDIYWVHPERVRADLIKFRRAQ